MSAPISSRLPSMAIASLRQFTKIAVAIGCMSLVISNSTSAQTPPAAGEVETWVDETGAHKIQAKFVKIEGDNVILQTAEGKTIPVPYAKLSLGSQFRAKKHADPKAFEAAPLPSASAPPPVAESPFPEDPTIEQFLDTILEQMKAGKPDVLWYAMPKTAQSDVEAIIIKSAEILGPKTLKQMQAVLPNLHVIVRDKRSFITANPRIAQRPEVAKQVNVVLQAAEPLVGLLTQSSTWSSENFKPGRASQWFMQFLNDTLKASDKMASTIKAANMGPEGAMRADSPIAMISNMTYKVKEKTNDTATVEFYDKGVKTGPKISKFKKVDGRWYDSEIEAGYAKIAETRSMLENLDKATIDQVRSVVSTTLTTSNAILGQLANAKTPQEFNQLVEPFVAQVDAQMRANPGMFNPPGPPGSQPPGGGKMSNMLRGPGNSPPPAATTPSP